MCMKKVVLLCFIHLLCFSVSGQSARYNEAKGYIRDKGYSISAEQYADLSQGAEAGYTKTFYEGLSYIIIAMSDDADVTDVDVYLRYPSGTAYDKDADSDRLAVIHFTPTYTREMRVVVKNYASNTPNYKSKCRILIGAK